MKLVTYLSGEGLPRAGVVRDDMIVDLGLWASAQEAGNLAPDLAMIDLIGLGDLGLELCRSAHASPVDKLESLGAIAPLRVERLLAPVPVPRRNVFCVGRNFSEHAAESARAFGETIETTTPWPTFFTKATTTVNGPYANIPYDERISKEIDWEGELAVVIGRRGKNLNRDEAMRHVFGYMVLNDISARDVQQRHGKQYFKGKSLDGSCPTGPWIITADEAGDPASFELWTRVNGVEKQHAGVGEMIYDVPYLIEALSLGMTLEPGDIIACGTPGGVGNGRDPKEFLRPGDVVEVEIDPIGTIRNAVWGV